MIAALGNLLESVIDYAGLFPPARLEMDQAVATYATERGGIHQAMLRHFIVPAKQHIKFEQFDATVAAGPPWTLAVLVGGGETLRDWTDHLDADLPAADSVVQKMENVAVRVLEIALPRGLAADTASFSQAVEEVLARTAACQLAECDLFFETTSNEHRHILAGVLSQLQRKHFRVGLKLRTGGLEPLHFPSNEVLAEVIQLCESAQIPWKATAGLHHPLPYDCAQIGATMHGFLNLLVGVILVGTNQLEADQLINLLEDRDPNHFLFTEDGLEWNGVSANRLQVSAGRERFISFGSCSFSEPIVDLEQLGLLPKPSSL